MSWYRPGPVAPGLRGALVCGWTARPAGRQLLVPDGCIDIVWLTDARLVVCGPETTAWSFALPPGAESAGVRFRPGVGAEVLGIAAHRLLDQRVGLEDILGSGAARRLAEQVSAAASPEQRVKVLEAAVGRRLADRGRMDSFPGNVTAALAERSWSIGDLADASGITDRQMQRRCRESFGYPPSTLRRILRLQRFMALSNSAAGQSTSLAMLAHLAGYTDQAHLSHDTRRVAGMTPRDLLASEAPRWHGAASVAAPAGGLAGAVAQPA